MGGVGCEDCCVVLEGFSSESPVDPSLLTVTLEDTVSSVFEEMASLSLVEA